MKTNKKAFRIIAIGILIMNINYLLLHYFINLSDVWQGLLQGTGIGVMIGGLIKMRKRRTC